MCDESPHRLLVKSVYASFRDGVVGWCVLVKYVYALCLGWRNLGKICGPIREHRMDKLDRRGAGSMIRSGR
jgi:hypothetical protein